MSPAMTDVPLMSPIERKRRRADRFGGASCDAGESPNLGLGATLATTHRKTSEYDSVSSPNRAVVRV
jgi:hypothetical protein